jgi:hypothetical protein
LKGVPPVRYAIISDAPVVACTTKADQLPDP